jgi:hypothetical protein
VIFDVNVMAWEVIILYMVLLLPAMMTPTLSTPMGAGRMSSIVVICGFCAKKLMLLQLEAAHATLKRIHLNVIFPDENDSK